MSRPLPIRIITNCDELAAYFYFNPSALSGLSFNSLPPEDRFHEIYMTYVHGGYMTIPAANEWPLPSRRDLVYEGCETAVPLFECVVRDFGLRFNTRADENEVRLLVLAQRSHSFSAYIIYRNSGTIIVSTGLTLRSEFMPTYCPVRRGSLPPQRLISSLVYVDTTLTTSLQLSIYGSPLSKL